MAGPQAQRPISQHEGTSASRALRPISHSRSNAGSCSTMGTTGPSVTAASGSSLFGGGGAIYTASTAAETNDQHIEISVDEEQQQLREKDVENAGTGKKIRHRHHHKRPLYRRVFNYIRHAWTGVKFSSSNGKYYYHIFPGKKKNAKKKNKKTNSK